ncbi:MAG TPA: NAD-dependent epimerase/dehydratase family protein [Casimicrobiaceae bacterium]
MTPAPVVVTGAGGFIGRAACASFAAAGRPFEGWSRASMGDLSAASEDALARALEGARCVVHVAGRAHARVSTEQLRRDNVEASRRVARAARRAGVERFLHVSSVKVNGEWTPPGRPFRPDDPPAPADAYARSKHEAELAVQGILQSSATTLAVLRLPLVYGPGAAGNFAALVAAVRAGRRLPLGAIRNRRHFASLANVVDALGAIIDASRPVAGAHFVADANSVSTPELVRAIAAAAGVPPRLAAVPVPLLVLGASLIGRGPAVARLTRSLEVDTSSLAAVTDWRPRAFGIDAATLA